MVDRNSIQAVFFLTFLAVTVFVPARVNAIVGDPQIKTDHPQMQGELSCSTFDRLQDTAFRQFKQRYGHEPKTDTEKLIAHWIWRVEHHQHADGNDVYYGKGNALAGKNGYGFCRDGLMGLFAHSTGLCYSIHAQFTPFIQRALGDMLATSCTLVPGHTAFEAFTDGQWRLADITCGHMVFHKDPKKPVGIIYILNFIAANKDHLKEKLKEFNGGFMKLRLGPFGDKLNTYDSVREPSGEGKQKMFGYLGMPIVYALRAGETFTRYSTPAGDDGVQAIWSTDYNEKACNFPKFHGMARRETFLRYGPVGNDNPGRFDKNVGRPKKKPLVYSGKGVFEYSPDLRDRKKRYEEGVYSSNKVRWKSGKLYAGGSGGSIVFSHASPYPIAAHQADNSDGHWKVETAHCDKTAIFSGECSGTLHLYVSTDLGGTWTDLGEVSKTFSIDFSDSVKGRFSYLIKIGFGKKAALKKFTLRTVVQIGPAVFPFLKDNGCRITYFASNLGVIHGGPDYHMANAFRAPKMDSGDWKVYRLTAPGPIRSLHGVSMVSGRVEMTVETSLDGKKWDSAMEPVTMARSGKAKNASIWGNGTNAIMWGYTTYAKGNSKTGYIRFKNSRENCTQVYATYEIPKKPTGLTVTVNWSEGGGATREAKKTFKASSKEQTWRIGTGANVVTNWIRFTPAKK